MAAAAPAGDRGGFRGGFGDRGRQVVLQKSRDEKCFSTKVMHVDSRKKSLAEKSLLNKPARLITLFFGFASDLNKLNQSTNV